jgi:hypothetical protein
LCAIRPVGDTDVALFDRSGRHTERRCGFSDGAVNHLLGLSARHALAAMLIPLPALHEQGRIADADGPAIIIQSATM